MYNSIKESWPSMNYFHDLFPDLLQFVISTVSNIASLVTGGVIIAALWLWDKFIRPISRKAWIRFLLFLVFVAFFNGWREQKAAADQKQSEIGQKQKEID